MYVLKCMCVQGKRGIMKCQVVNAFDLPPSHE